MKILVEGSWWMHSEKDPRWNATGRGFVGGMAMPEECRKKLGELQAEFGEPPDDVEWGYLKDE